MTSDEVEKLAARLDATATEITDWNGQTMKHWDSWRAYIAKGGGGSWPRDAFESLMDCHADAMKEAAALIRRLRDERDSARVKINELYSERDAARNKALDEAMTSLLHVPRFYTGRISTKSAVEAILALKSQEPSPSKETDWGPPVGKESI